MWLFVFFDLPVATKKERKDATLFRKLLMKDGFNMMQFSVYTRHCASAEKAEMHVNRIKVYIPNKGQISILTVTDKQYGQIFNFFGRMEKPKMPTPQQLEMF